MAELRNPPASVPRNTKPETVSLPPAPVSGPAPANPAPAPPAPVQVVAPPEIRAEPEPAAPAKPVRPKDIRAVHRLYIEKMADELDSHIKEEIRKQMPGLSLLSQRSGADAIMKGSAEKHDDTGSTVTRGYLGIKSTYSATVRITDAEGVNLLWSAEAGDSRALIGAFRRGGPKKVAERIVENLKKAMER